MGLGILESTYQRQDALDCSCPLTLQIDSC